MDTSRAIFAALALVLLAAGHAHAQNVRVEPPGWESPFVPGTDPHVFDPFSFGEVPLGSENTVTFQVHSVGPTPLTVSGIMVVDDPDAAFEIIGMDTIPLELTAGAWFDVPIRYQPGAIGNHSAVLRIVSNDRETPVLDGPLTGRAVPEPACLALLVGGGGALLRRRRHLRRKR